MTISSNSSIGFRVPSLKTVMMSALLVTGSKGQQGLDVGTPSRLASLPNLSPTIYTETVSTIYPQTTECIVKQTNGVLFTGLCKDKDFVFGVKEYPSGGLDIGSFNVNGLHGTSCTRIFPDGRTLRGQFSNNEPVMTKKTTELGPKKEGVLHGENCTQIDDNASVIRRGSFKFGKLDGFGTQVFRGGPANGGVEEDGVYRNGDFEHGTVTYSDGRVQSGPRVKGKEGLVLEGENCTSFFPGIKTQRGTFVGNDLIFGTSNYADGHNDTGPFLKNMLNGENCERRWGSEDYLIGAFANDKPLGYIEHFLPGNQSRTEFYTAGNLMSWGTYPDHILERGVSCRSLFESSQTPYLQNMELTKQYVAFMKIIDSVMDKAFDKYLERVAKKTKAGQEIIESILGWRQNEWEFSDYSPFTDDVMGAMTTKNDKEKLAVNVFIASLAINHYGSNYYKKACKAIVKNMLEKDFPLVRMASRHESPLMPFLEDWVENIAVFGTFLKIAASFVNQHMPSISMMTFFEYDNEGVGFPIYVLNREGYNSFYKSYYGTQKVKTPEDLLLVSTGHDFKDTKFIGHLFSIPIEAINTGLTGNPFHRYSVTDTVYFQIPDDSSRINLTKLDQWSVCAKTVLETVHKETSAQINPGWDLWSIFKFWT